MVNFIVSMLILIAFLGGCAHEPLISFTRSYPTGLGNDEAVCIVLDKYCQCPASSSGSDYFFVMNGLKNCESWNCTESQSKEKQFDSFIGREMKKFKPDINVVLSDKFRSTAFPGKAFEVCKLGPDSILQLLNDAEFLNRISQTGIRYFIILDSRSAKAGTETHYPIWGPGLWAICKTGDEIVNVTATIVDIKFKRISGSISSRTSGEVGSCVPVLLVIPLPRTAYIDLPDSVYHETSAWTGIAEPLVRFLENKDGGS